MTKKTQGVTIEPLKMKEVQLCILGTEPLIFNRKSPSTMRDLLLPAPPKNRAAKRKELKHDPLREFRESVYTDPRDDAPTRLVFPAPGFKGAAMTAALEIPGATKASTGRLLRVVGYQVAIYGIPQLFMTGVKNLGMNRTPDVRTRAIVPEWATVITVRFPLGTMTETSVANLFAAAGQVCGVGDFRQEKGKGSFGTFSLVNEDDERFLQVVEIGGRDSQDAALANPEAFDDLSAELWTWFEEEIVARGREQEVARVSG